MLVTWEKEMVKIVSKNEENLNVLGDLWEKLMNTLSTTHARVPVWKLQTQSRWRNDRQGEDAPKCPQEHPACTELLRRVRGRLIIVCGAPRPMAWESKKKKKHHCTTTYTQLCIVQEAREEIGRKIDFAQPTFTLVWRLLLLGYVFFFFRKWTLKTWKWALKWPFYLNANENTQKSERKQVVWWRWSTCYSFFISISEQRLASPVDQVGQNTAFGGFEISGQIPGLHSHRLLFFFFFATKFHAGAINRRTSTSRAKLENQ